ncbi:MAG: GNAT family N-acetyltransferase [Solirubrobacteraceae bacterium]
MTGKLRDALAADRAIRRRAADEVIRIAGGVALRHPDLDDVHYINAVLLDAGPEPLDAAGVVTVADRWLGDLDHRHVVFDDARAGERAAAQLIGAGWERTRTCFMVFAADPGAVASDPRSRAISEDEMQALQLAGLRAEAPEVDARAGLVARLATTQTILRQATPSRCFGAGEPGEGLAAMCTLFLDADVNGRAVATVEEVGTLPARRGRGLARAVVLEAVAAAGRWGAERILVPADADDWPQLMYARLGFAAVGRQVALTRRIRPRPGSVAGAV